MLSIYTFVFSVVFQGRWGQGASDNQFEFALTMFSGLILFNLFSEAINRAPNLITTNVNYVKRVVFPLEILPVVTLLSGLVNSVISFVILLIGLFLLATPPTAVILLGIVPVVIPLLFIILGCSWILASLGVFVKDISNIIALAVNALFFLTPIFYPISAVPDFFRNLMYINPLTGIIENFRNAVMFHIYPSIESIVLQIMFSYIFMIFGYLWFKKTRRGFADVL
jgi:lipopolysaccharide transport system permease protein